MEDGELEAVVLEEEIGGVARTELEAVGARERVLARQVALGDAVAKRDQPARLVRRLGLRVGDELLADRRRDYQRVSSEKARDRKILRSRRTP